MIIQTVWLYEDRKKMDFETVIDWKQEHLLLKAAFPVSIRASEAVYDIQFGAVSRPTHSNTSWDAAKYEVCAHKYCDLSEYGYGVSLLNDCKYGYDVHDSVMRLTLLKSATFPNPDADRCRHVFTYTLAPHVDDYRKAGILQMAYDLNNPMRAVPVIRPEADGKIPARYSLVEVASPNVIADTIKKAEESNAVIIRFFEACGSHCETMVKLGWKPAKATLCDLMERELSDIDLKGDSFLLRAKPYEILTVKVE